jgi:hypothetical protein
MGGASSDHRRCCVGKRLSQGYRLELIDSRRREPKGKLLLLRIEDMDDMVTANLENRQIGRGFD